MIAYLRGVVAAVDFEQVVLDVHGIGYGVHMTVGDTAKLQNGQEVELFISEVVREQAFDLYGFTTKKQQEIFAQLIKVNGVGPRLGLALLGLGDMNDLFQAVAREDVTYLTRAPGVGKKLAERLIIELRDKVSGYDLASHHPGSADTQDTIEAESALAALGFKHDDIARMLKDVDRSQSVEDQLKAALRSQ